MDPIQTDCKPYQNKQAFDVAVVQNYCEVQTWAP